MAGLPDGYYTSRLGKASLYKQGLHYKLKLDFKPLGEKLDYAQDVLDAAVWNDVQKYMPVDTGALKSATNTLNVNERGRVWLYPPDSEYGHYQHEGVVYVDPITGKGAFYSPEYGFWSRPGVTKVPSDRQLTYSQPDATAHWGETAFNNHADEWVAVVQRALNS